VLKLSRLAAAIAALSLTVPVVALADEAAPSLEVLAAQLKAQQAQIEALSAEIEKKESSAGGEWFKNTTLGGYGEAQFYHYDNAPDQYDAYRFVLYVGHQFSDTVRLQSELEVEHGFAADTDTTCTVSDANANGTLQASEVVCGKASTKPGEVELEQMYLEWDYIGEQKLAVGQILVPVGFMNETHEPTTFYGVKRNPVETAIIPTTWWEGAVKASGEILPGLGYDAMVSTGLKTSKGELRSGRQKGAKAVAEDLAYTARLKYTGIKGLELGATYHQQADISQDNAVGNGDKAELVEVHAGYQIAGFSARALYGQWNIEGLSNTANWNNAEGNDQNGGYLELGYKPLEKVGVFARYSEWTKWTADSSTTTSTTNGAIDHIGQWNYGVNYWLTPRAVLKLDVQDQQNVKLAAGGKDEDGFALGMGYSF